MKSKTVANPVKSWNILPQNFKRLFPLAGDESPIKISIIKAGNVGKI